MKYYKRHKLTKIIYGILGLIVIPIYAVLFSQIGPNGDLILVTFSQIGSRYGGLEGLILWGIITSVFFFSFLHYLSIITKVKNILMEICIAIGCLSMLISVFLPFAPTMFPIASETHNFLAYLTAVSVCVSLLFFILAIKRIDLSIFHKSLILYLIILFIGITVYITVGVSSLFQIILVVSFCSFLFIELVIVEKSDKINIFEALEEYENTRNQENDIF